MLPKMVFLQLSSEQFVGGYVWIAQLDRKRVLQARSSGCKSSVAVTAECSVRGTTQAGTSADHREHRVLSDTRQQSPAEKRRACPDSDWRTRHVTLNFSM